MKPEDCPLSIPATGRTDWSGDDANSQRKGSILVRGGRKILDNSSLDVAEGKRILIQGDNGSGKTCLLQAILGFFLLKRDRFSGGLPSRKPILAKVSPQAGLGSQEVVLHRFPIAVEEVVPIGLTGTGIRGLLPIIMP